MRVLVFFDLPTESLEDKREYRNFRKFLIKKGFIMMQESVYCKLALNQTVSTATIEALRRNRPAKGLVQILAVTEKQFSRMEYLCGENKSTILDSAEKMVIL